jgi:RNA polymerase sigma factor (sigma-70 family)
MGCHMGPSLDDAVLRLVHTFQDGKPEAAEPLWNAYFGRLVRLALDHLRSHSSPDPRADSEDVAISAFNSFCHAVSEGRFPRLEDRHALWNILVVITRRKVVDLVERERRQKRGGRCQRLDAPVEQMPGREPGPEEAAIAADLYWTLFASLGNDQLRAAAQLHLEGWTVAEIAEFLGCSISTIDRRLRRVRKTAETLWGAMDAPAD